MNPHALAAAVAAGETPDLTGLDRVVQIDSDSGIVQVEAGATWGRLEAALAQRALTLGPLLDGLRDEQIATTWAQNAQRRPSAFYGLLTDTIIAVQAALPDGRLTQASVSPKRSVGPDLPRCTLGAGWSAGVLSMVHVQAWPRPRQVHWHAARFGDWTSAIEAVLATQRAGAPTAWVDISRGGGKVQVSARLDCQSDEQMHRFVRALGGSSCDGARAEYERAVQGYAHPLRCVFDGPRTEAAKAAAKTRGGRILRVEPHRAAVYARDGGPSEDAAWQTLAEQVFAALAQEAK
jgi:FAD/FMN-containing dehydrogenase